MRLNPIRAHEPMRHRHLMQISALLVAISVFFFACFAARSNFTWQNVRQLQIGMTKDEVTARMGQSGAINSRGVQEVWAWVHVNATPLGADTKCVSVVFQNGKVTEVPTIPSEFHD